MALVQLSPVLRGGFHLVPFLPLGGWIDNLVFGAAGAFNYTVPTVVSTVPPRATLTAMNFRIVSSAALWFNGTAPIAAIPAANVLTGLGSVLIPPNLPYCVNEPGGTLYFFATAAASVSIEAWV